MEINEMDENALDFWKEYKEKIIWLYENYNEDNK